VAESTAERVPGFVTAPVRRPHASGTASPPTSGAPREVVLLGATGSIGTQAIDVITRNPDRFRVVGLAGGGGRVDLLAAQALELGVEVVAVARASAAQDLQLAFYAEAARRGYGKGAYAVPKILAGPEASAEIATWPCDIVLNGMTGSVGLGPTLSALRAGRTVALANKESLVAGGPLVLDALGGDLDRLIPVDSEHSALAQCLRGGRASEVRRLVLTASGGPFRGRRRDELAAVTRAEALAHPTWDMGPVITINSATLVNKGLELIETHLFFGVPYDDIAVVVHPQSLVHSMVEFHDGSTLAQISPPDMRLPIALALGWPERVPDAQQPMDWTRAQSLTFEPLDPEAFPAVDLARHCGQLGGSAPAVFNASNEEAVAAFLDGRLPFTGIVDTVARVVDELASRELSSLDEVLEVEGAARARARALVGAPAA
jgi:1-deoxy-D-xylulose-5-phosphate reductoisomerase